MIRNAGRPNEAITLENIKQVLKIVIDDYKLKFCETAGMVNIYTVSASAILYEILRMKMVFSEWMPNLLTMEQKQQIDDSERCLALFTRDKQDFLHRFVKNGWNMDPRNVKKQSF